METAQVKSLIQGHNSFLKRAKRGMSPVGTVQLEVNHGLISQFPVSLPQHGSQIGKIGVSVIFHKSLDC